MTDRPHPNAPPEQHGDHWLAVAIDHFDGRRYEAAHAAARISGVFYLRAGDALAAQQLAVDALGLAGPTGTQLAAGERPAGAA